MFWKVRTEELEADSVFVTHLSTKLTEGENGLRTPKKPKVETAYAALLCSAQGDPKAKNKNKGTVASSSNKSTEGREGLLPYSRQCHRDQESRV